MRSTEADIIAIHVCECECTVIRLHLPTAVDCLEWWWSPFAVLHWCLLMVAGPCAQQLVPVGIAHSSYTCRCSNRKDSRRVEFPH